MPDPMKMATLVDEFIECMTSRATRKDNTVSWPTLVGLYEGFIMSLRDNEENRKMLTGLMKNIRSNVVYKSGDLVDVE